MSIVFRDVHGVIIRVEVDIADSVEGTLYPLNESAKSVEDFNVASTPVGDKETTRFIEIAAVWTSFMIPRQLRPGPFVGKDGSPAALAQIVWLACLHIRMIARVHTFATMSKAHIVFVLVSARRSV